MTDLELEPKPGADTNGHSDEDVPAIDLAHVLASITFDGTDVAGPDEAAAVATAIGAHLRDRRAAAAATDDEPETVDRWALAGRYDRAGVPKQQRPRDVERGTEWRAAARTL